MRIHPIDPIKDTRWAELVQSDPKASVFHTVGWLKTLRDTYGYEPVVFTTSSPTGTLKNGLVFCRIKSWLTGHRLVSLPFSDHCEPLCDSAEDLNFLKRYLQAASQHQNWRYLELRPVDGNFGQLDSDNGFSPASKYFLHTLSLRPSVDELFQALDRDCVQRRIRRAERADLVETTGNSEELIRQFYSLFVVTRARHRLPPIPYAWFRNLVRCLGNAMEIRLACKDRTPISAILTLRFRDVAYYKYGCSDERFNRFGATPWLMWRAIVAAKKNGANEFDMGRTEDDNEGLLTFKNHWNPRPTRLIYWRFPESVSLDSAGNWKLRAAKGAFGCLPDRALVLIGKLIYRHIG